MTELGKRLKDDVLLLDGAMGTQLMDRGISAGETSETWVIERPDDISEIHKAYFDAGADIVITNTFGGTSIKLAAFGLDGKVGEINERAAGLARKVCPSGKFVAGDIGPTGKLLKPYGDGDEDEFLEAFTVQAGALKEGGVDLIIIETMMDLNEALIALKAAKTTGLPVFVSITFDKKKRGYFTMMGNRPDEVSGALVDAGATVIGTNCNLRIGDMVGLVGELSQATSLPILAEPNAGSPELVDGKPKYTDGPDAFAKKTSDLINAGARVVGGCCGTTPETTRKMRAVIDKR